MHLYNRGSSYYLVVNVPCDLIPIYRKKQIWVSLRTKDKNIANIRSLMILSKLEYQFLIERQKMSVFKNAHIRFTLDYNGMPRPKDSFTYGEADIESFALDFCMNKTWECNSMNNVRYAIADDAQSIVQINVTAWKEAYKGLLPEELLISRKVDEKRINGWKKKIDDKSSTVLVYEDGGEVRGYLSAGPKRDDIQYNNELYSIYVDPSFQKQGIGSSLFEEYKKTIKNSSFYLYMLSGNNNASAFYKKMGGHRDMKYDRILNVDNYEIKEIIYIFE